MKIKVYKYGLLEPIEGWDDQALHVLFLRNRLWNNFVALEHAHRNDYRTLMHNASPELTGIQARIEAIEIKRKTIANPPMDADPITTDSALPQRPTQKKDDQDTLYAELKQLRLKAKQLREEIKGLIKPLVTELQTQRYRRVRELVRDSGLWWCNSRTVEDAYEFGRSRAMQEGGALKFHAFDGSGKYHVQRTGGFSLEEITSGRFSFCRIEEAVERKSEVLSERSKRSRARHLLIMTIASERPIGQPKKRLTVSWPIVLHRELPTDGIIKYIEVVRKRVGNRFEWSCSITVGVPEGADEQRLTSSKMVCGIDLGFRQTDDGLRVATVADSFGSIKHYVINQQSMDYVEEIQKKIAEKTKAAWQLLRPILVDMRPYPEELAERIVGMLKAGDKPPNRAMVSLLNKLRAEPELSPKALTILDNWSTSIRMQSREMNDLRQKWLRRRKDRYRNIAAEIASRYSSVKIAALNLKDMAKSHRSDGSVSKLYPTARKNRYRAALSELSLCIEQACKKSGSMFEKIDPTKISRTCSYCGYINEVDEGDLVIICESCESKHDRDENAAKIYLKSGT